MRAIRPEMPHPSSTMVEDDESREWAQRGFDAREIHSAKRGVIFQRTVPWVRWSEGDS